MTLNKFVDVKCVVEQRKVGQGIPVTYRKTKYLTIVSKEYYLEWYLLWLYMSFEISSDAKIFRIMVHRFGEVC